MAPVIKEIRAELTRYEATRKDENDAYDEFHYALWRILEYGSMCHIADINNDGVDEYVFGGHEDSINCFNIAVIAFDSEKNLNSLLCLEIRN